MPRYVLAIVASVYIGRLVLYVDLNYLYYSSNFYFPIKKEIGMDSKKIGIYSRFKYQQNLG